MKHELIIGKSPFSSCHASTILTMNDELLVAFFAGECEGSDDVGIWLSRKKSHCWSEPQKVAGDYCPCWNPVLCEYPKGTIKLFFKEGTNCSRWWGMVCESYDGGNSWTAPQKLPPEFWGPIKNKPVVIDDVLICPSSTEYDGWRVHVEFFDGVNWTKTLFLNEKDTFEAIQPTILMHSEQKLQLLCRTYQGVIATAYSLDQGRSWGEMRNTSLPNPNSGIDGTTLADGSFLLVYNPTVKKPTSWGGPRTPLHLAHSKDGENWSDIAILEDTPGEFSYPAIIAEGNDIHITYTWKRKNICYRYLDMNEIF